MSSQQTRVKPNCLLCDKMLTCKNPGRGAGFSCDKFVVMSRQQATYVSSLFVDDDPRPVSRTQGRFGASAGDELTDDDENSLLSLVSSVLDDKSGSGLVARDIRIDDRDIPEHPNFFTWNTRPNGSGVRPFARQLWIGLKLFAEWCQDCSDDKKIMLDIEDCPKDMEIEEFSERIQLLDYGVCPCCGKTKLDLFDDRDLDPYQELVLCLGQRSGKSIMTSMFVAYVMHKLLKLQKPTEVYGVLSNTTLTATFVALTYDRAHKLLWSPIKDLMTDAPWFCVGKGTEIRLADGTSKPIETILPGDIVATLDGPESVVHLFDNGVQNTYRVTLENGYTLEATDGHKVRVVSEDGLSLIWKKVKDLTEKDHVVVE